MRPFNPVQFPPSFVLLRSGNKIPYCAYPPALLVNELSTGLNDPPDGKHELGGEALSKVEATTFSHGLLIATMQAGSP